MPDNTFAPEDTCAIAKDGIHAPDWSHVSAKFVGETLTIFLYCYHCRKRGCLGPAEELDKQMTWDI